VAQMDDRSPPAPLEREPKSKSGYVRVLPAPEPQWQTRIGSIVGLIVLVMTASLAIALGTYQLGLVLNRLIQTLLGK
jgi:hypothetical protein